MSRAAELQVTAAACRQATSLTAHLFFDFKQFVFGVGLPDDDDALVQNAEAGSGRSESAHGAL
jgi:uncharacterized protein YgfB (UPF0149 family)